MRKVPEYFYQLFLALVLVMLAIVVLSLRIKDSNNCFHIWSQIVGSHLDNTASIIVLYHVEWYCDKVF